jgi:hypothetical protein
MKHCPNPNCPFLAQMGMVAEFHDPVEFCADCGTALVPGEAPDVEQLPVTSSLSDEQIADMATLCTLDSVEDAALFQAKLEFQTIPATIVPITADADEDAGDPIELFEIHVRRDDLLRATYLLDAWMAEELEDAGDNDIDEADLDDTDLDDDSAWEATANAPSERDLPVDASVAARVSAYESGASERTSARSEDLPIEKTGGSNPVILIGVILVVVLLVLFVLLRMM